MDSSGGMPGGKQRVGAVLLEKGMPGFTFGRQEAFMGLRGMPSCDLYFDDVEVPEENLVIQAGDFGNLMLTFDIERCGNSAMCLGIAAGALDAARLLVYRAATGAGQGLASIYEASMAKCHANEMVRDVTDKAMQIFGGYGYSREYPLERMLRDARAWGGRRRHPPDAAHHHGQHVARTAI